MFDVAPTELLLLGIVALVVIGPKDLPRAMRFVGKWVGRARGMARHFRDGMDEMIRQSELEDMEKKWREENERIMREHPAPTPGHDYGHPAVIDQPPAALPAPDPHPDPDPEAVADEAAMRPAVPPAPAIHPAAPAAPPAGEPRP